jgi:DNA processing protein
MVVVSGMAFGIDACAHRGALETGLTVAVLGCGPDVAYPAAHRSLWRRIGERGLVLSELPPGTGAWRWTFPARNRVMAALAGMTVVVEAAERSGSLITADLATDLGRDLGAVPGPVSSRSSAGPNSLLAGGACLVRDAQDVLDAMLGPGMSAPTAPAGPPIDSLGVDVLDAVERGEDTCDAIAEALELTGAEAAAALAGLEAHGYLTCSLVGVYSRTLLQPRAAI